MWLLYVIFGIIAAVVIFGITGLVKFNRGSLAGARQPAAALDHEPTPRPEPPPSTAHPPPTPDLPGPPRTPKAPDRSEPSEPDDAYDRRRPHEPFSWDQSW
jgi:hypothetical protein